VKTGSKSSTVDELGPTSLEKFIQAILPPFNQRSLSPNCILSCAFREMLNDPKSITVTIKSCSL
jgi:hypothetical protein